MMLREDVNEFASLTVWKDEAIASRERVIAAQAAELASQKAIIAVLIEKVEFFSQLTRGLEVKPEPVPEPETAQCARCPKVFTLVKQKNRTLCPRCVKKSYDLRYQKRLAERPDTLRMAG